MTNPEGFPAPAAAQAAAEKNGLSPDDFGPSGQLREVNPDKANSIGYDTKEVAEDANYHNEKARTALDHRLSLEDQVLNGSDEVTENDLLVAKAKESALEGIAVEANAELAVAEQQAGEEYEHETRAQAA